MQKSTESKLRSLSVQQKKQPDSKSPVNSLLNLNSLIYKVPMQNSLVVARNVQTFSSNSTEYNQNSPSMDFVLQTGDQLLDGRASTLSFTLQVTAANASNYHWGIGSVLNMFDTVLVIARNGGSELDRLENPSVFKSQEHKVHKSKRWRESVGLQAGYGMAARAHNAAAITFHVNLSDISELFNSPQLIPSQCAQGLRLRFIFAPTASMFKWDVAPGAVTWTITSPKLNLTCCTVSDAAKRAIELNCVSNGLEIPIISHHRENVGFTTVQSQVISKAVARATKVTSIYRTTADIASPTADSVRGLALTGVLNEYSVRCGAQYFPQQPILGVADNYAMRLQAEDKRDGDTALTSTDFDTNGYSALSRSLETSHLIKFSGISVNNSKSVSVNCKQVNGGATPRQADTYLSYMSVIRVYPNNIVVDN